MVSRRAEVFVVLGEPLLEIDEVACFVEIGRDVANAAREVVPERPLRFGVGRHEELELLTAVVAELIVAIGRAREPHQREVRRQRAVQPHRVHRGQQHAFEKVAARTEKDDAAWVRDAIGRQALAKRIARRAVTAGLHRRGDHLVGHRYARTARASSTAATSARRAGSTAPLRWIRTPRRWRLSSDIQSPSACAASSVRNPTFMPGITISSGSSAVICITTHSSGPPLCSCPVEWRKRGPKPTVVATRCASRTLVRRSVSSPACVSLRAMYAVMAL